MSRTASEGRDELARRQRSNQDDDADGDDDETDDDDLGPVFEDLGQLRHQPEGVWSACAWMVAHVARTDLQAAFEPDGFAPVLQQIFTVLDAERGTYVGWLVGWLVVGWGDWAVVMVCWRAQRGRD